jgi:hypothetical protein
MTTQYRAVLDADISFGHGGGLTAHGFRVDVPTGAAVGRLFVASLDLLLADSVTVRNLRISRSPPKAPETDTATNAQACSSSSPTPGYPEPVILSFAVMSSCSGSSGRTTSSKRSQGVRLVRAFSREVPTLAVLHVQGSVAPVPRRPP